MQATEVNLKLWMKARLKRSGQRVLIAYIHDDNTVNLTNDGGINFRSQHTPISELEFPNEDGNYSELAAVEVSDIKPPPVPEKKPQPKLAIPPKTTAVQGDQFLMPMSKIEAQTLVNQIRSGMNAIGEKLLQLYEHEGWKALGYDNWRECVAKEFDFEQSRAYRLLAFAEVTRNLSPIGENVPMPTAESQVRPIAGLSAEQQREVYTNAVAANHGDVPTAKQVEQAVANLDATDQHEISPENLNVIETSREETTLLISTQSTGRQKPKSNVKGAGRDQCQTPPYALIPLIPYIDPSWTVWEPAAGKGRLVDALTPHVSRVIATDILTGQDFMTIDPPAFDALITNPPYGPKYEWLPRCYALGKPFALLIPGETLFAEGGQVLFEQYGLELITFYPRVDFEMPNMGFDGDGSTFPTAWFTWGLNIGRAITRVYIGKEKKAFEDSLKVISP